MNQERQREIRKAKRNVYVVFWVMVALIVLGAVGVVRWMLRPLDDTVTTKGLSSMTMTGTYILAKTEEGYYETDGSQLFCEQFAFADWLSVPEPPQEEPVVTLRFAEQYTLKLYASGRAVAFNGYAASGRNPAAYYTTPQGTAEAVADWLSENGVFHTRGDGTIGMSTFQ